MHSSLKSTVTCSKMKTQKAISLMSKNIHDYNQTWNWEKRAEMIVWVMSVGVCARVCCSCWASVVRVHTNRGSAPSCQSQWAVVSMPTVCTPICILSAWVASVHVRKRGQEKTKCCLLRRRSYSWS